VLRPAAAGLEGGTVEREPAEPDEIDTATGQRASLVCFVEALYARRIYVGSRHLSVGSVSETSSP
jgi:hypothetical protein